MLNYVREVCIDCYQPIVSLKALKGTTSTNSIRENQPLDLGLSSSTDWLHTCLSDAVP